MIGTKECQICYNEISAKAKKCQYCHEWQGDFDNYLEEDLKVYEAIGFREKFPIAKKPFQLLLVEKLPFHYGISILIICVIVFGFVQISWYKLNEDRIYLLSFLPYLIQMIVAWAGIIWFDEVLKNNYHNTILVSTDFEKAEERFISAHGIMFNRKLAIISGIFVGLIASFGEYIIGTPFVTEQAKLLYAVLEFVNMFFVGAAIYSMVVFAIFINNLSLDSDSNFISFEKSLAIDSIGNIHLKSAFLAIVPLFLGVIAKFIGYWEWSMLIVLWYVSFAFIIVAYIYWPIQNIHKLMVGNNDSQISILHEKIKDVLHEINFDPSSRNFKKLHDLRSIENSIANQSTWPFDTRSISAAFLAIIFPIILIIIDKIWSI